MNEEKIIGFGKEIKGVLTAASREESRYYLHGVLIEKDGYAISTNGHILIKIPLKQLDKGELPEQLKAESLEDNVWIPLSMVEKSLKILPKPSSIEAINYILVKVKDGEIVLSSTDLDTVNEVKGKREEDVSFPDYESQIVNSLKEKKPKLEIGFMVETLKQMLNAISLCQNGRQEVIKFNFFSDVEGALVEFDSQHGKGIGVIMPARK